MSIFMRTEKQNKLHMSDIQIEVFYQIITSFGFCKYYPNPKAGIIKDVTTKKRYTLSGLNEFRNFEGHITLRTYLGPNNTVGNAHLTLDHPHWVNNVYTQEEVDAANFLLHGLFKQREDVIAENTYVSEEQF